MSKVVELSEQEKTVITSIMNSLVSLRVRLGQLRSQYLLEESSLMEAVRNAEEGFSSQLKLFANMKGLDMSGSGLEFDTTTMTFISK